MPSTLTVGLKDGKQSKKIERNPRKRIFIEILLRGSALIFCLFAQGLNDAQSTVVTADASAGEPAHAGFQR
jgi:hypothetical protein